MLLILLDNIRSALNVGSILRTAEAVGAEVWFCGITPTPDNPRVSKTALGAEKRIKWRSFKNTSDAVAKARKEIKNVKVYALEVVKGAKSYADADFRGNVALIFGHEVIGVSERALSLADEVLQIPMKGQNSSINVAVAVGVVLYEVVRQTRDDSREKNIKKPARATR